MKTVLLIRLYNNGGDVLIWYFMHFDFYNYFYINLVVKSCSHWNINVHGKILCLLHLSLSIRIP